MSDYPDDIFAEAAGVADMSACASWGEVANLVAAALLAERSAQARYWQDKLEAERRAQAERDAVIADGEALLPISLSAQMHLSAVAAAIRASVKP